MVRYSFPFSFASKTHGDDIAESWGSSNDAQLVWETADANANALILKLPAGGAVDVPVFAIGDDTILNKDLGLFNGITAPTFAVLSDDATKFISLSTTNTIASLSSSSGTSLKLAPGDGIVFLQDDYQYRFGTSGDAVLIWETADANAHTFLLALPGADGTNVPVFAIGNKTAPDVINADLGFFNGITQPTFAWLDTTNTHYARANCDGNTLVFNTNGFGYKFDRRIQEKKGSDIASANDITLGADGNFFDITGTTQINTISASNWQAGSVVILQFDGSVTVKHATAGAGAQMLLSGSADFSATADDTLMLVYDGATWREISRTVI